MKKDRTLCLVCGNNVAVSFPGEIIQRHKSEIKRLNGAICSASGRTLSSYQIYSFVCLYHEWYDVDCKSCKGYGEVAMNRG